MRIGRGEVVDQLREGEADLVAGSIEGGGVRRSGFDGEQRRRSSGYSGGARGRGGSSRNWSMGSSSLAARGCGGAGGGVSAGRVAVEWRGDGGVELVGVHGGAAACSGV